MIKHKNSGEEISDFPHYYKWNGIYGYLMFFDSKVFFFYGLSDTTYYEDITEEFI